MTNIKRKRRGICCYRFPRPSRKHGVVPSATYTWIYKKGNTVAIKGMGALPKRMPHKCSHGNTGRAYSVTDHVVDIVVNKQIKGKILAKRMCLLSILSILRAKIASKNVWCQREGSWVQLKSKPAPPREAMLCKNKWKGAWAAETHSLWINDITSIFF